MNKSQARANFWELGVLAEWQLRPDQFPVYEHLKAHRKPFLECSRRYGKTTTILVYVLEKLLENPGWICRWVLPEKEQARTILKPEVDRIQEDCPEHYKFKWHHVDSYYRHENGSKIFVYGIDRDAGKRLRGQKSNIIVNDEYGFWSHPHIVASVLGPQLLTTRGQMIFASTPSEDLAHPYYDYRAEAEIDGRLVQRFVHDNASLSEDDILQAEKDCGGRASPVFQREYLLNPMADPDRLVVPEYSEDLVAIDDDHPAPQFFDAYVGGDSGADDNTAVFFGYYDFRNDVDVIEDELVLRGKTSEEIVTRCREIEKRLWPDQTPYSRVYDAAKQLLLDICVVHKYSVVAPRKDDKHAAIHQWRMRVAAGKFKVKRRCKHLHRQMRVGMWRDDKKSDFERSEELGHLDAIAGALYFQRSIQRTRNPWPPHYGMNPETHHIGLLERDPCQPDATALQSVLRPRFRRG